MPRPDLTRLLTLLLGLGTFVLPATPATAAPAADERSTDDDASDEGCPPRDDDGQPAQVRTLLTFDAAKGENPENITIDRHGNVYVALLFARTVIRLDPRGRVERVVLPAGETAGLAINPLRPDQLTVAVISTDPAVAGLWTVPLSAFRGRGTPQRAVALPPNSFPNGVTYDGRGNLYVADSSLGRIWRVTPGSRTATAWLVDPLLDPTGAKIGDFVLPGANGVKIARGRVWVSNTSSSKLLSAPLRRDGSAGALSVTFADLIGLDDFQVTRRGGVIAALNGTSQVVSIAPDGQVRVLQDAAGGSRNPSAVAVSDDGDIYVTNAAFFTTGPSLQLIER